MYNIFIGWSGNKPLADKLSDLIAQSGRMRPIVGGGVPSDMFVGAQVIDQINRCKKAILLAEDKDGMLSHNLMFEWGYVMARLDIHDIHVFLINKNSRDLPSDLLGSWVSEVLVDRSKESDEEIAKRVFDIFLPNAMQEREIAYFDLIDNWKQVFVNLTDDIADSNQEVFDYVFTGCMAAYYYQDYQNLRMVLNGFHVNQQTLIFVNFAKAYIDVFIDSENLTSPLPQDSFFNCVQAFETAKGRGRVYDEIRELLFDILVSDIFALSCSLYLKNPDLDKDTVEHCSEMAKKNVNDVLALISDFEKKSPVNSTLVLLLRSYIFKDAAHIYLSQYNDRENFFAYLEKSVSERKMLWQTVLAYYPRNVFLSTKFEQEYILALSEYCNYMPNSFQKTLYKKTILSKMKEWEKELVYASSLTDKIKGNIKNFGD